MIHLTDANRRDYKDITTCIDCFRSCKNSLGIIRRQFFSSAYFDHLLSCVLLKMFSYMTHHSQSNFSCSILEPDTHMRCLISPTSVTIQIEYDTLHSGLGFHSMTSPLCTTWKGISLQEIFEIFRLLKRWGGYSKIVIQLVMKTFG